LREVVATLADAVNRAACGQAIPPGLPPVGIEPPDIGVEGFSIPADHRDIPADCFSVPAGPQDVPADVPALDADCLPVPVEYRHSPVD
jgi:hypothetical protein